MGAGEIRAGRAFVEINAKVDPLQQGLRAAQRLIANFASNASIAKVVGGIAIGGGGIAASLQALMGLQDSLAQIRSVAQPTAAQLRQIEAAADAMATRLATAPKDVISAMTELLRAGMTLTDVLGGATEAAIHFAKVGALPIAQAAVVLSDALHVFTGEMLTAGRAADILSSAADASSTDIAGMTNAFSQASAVFGQTGQSLEDLSAALAILANQGIKGEEAGTALKTMMLRLMAPAEEGARAVRDFGINVRDARGHLLSFPQIIAELQARLGNLNDATRDSALRDLFGDRAIRAGVVFLKAGAQGFADMRTQMSGSLSVAQKFATINDTLSAQMESFWAATQKLGAAIGEIFGPTVSVALGVFTKLADVLADVLKPLSGATGQFLALFLVYKAISTVGSGIPALFKALTGLGAGMSGTIQKLRDMLLYLRGIKLEVVEISGAQARSANGMWARVDPSYRGNRRDARRGPGLAGGAALLGSALPVLAGGGSGGAISIVASEFGQITTTALALRDAMGGAMEVAKSAGVAAAGSAASWGFLGRALGLVSSAISGVISTLAGAPLIIAGVAAAVVLAANTINNAMLYKAKPEDTKQATYETSRKQADADVKPVERLKSIAAGGSVLRGAQYAEAERILTDLNGRYGDIGVTLDATTGKLNVAGDAWGRLRERMNAPQIQQAKNALAEVEKNIAGFNREISDAQNYDRYNPIAGITGGDFDKNIAPAVEARNKALADRARILRELKQLDGSDRRVDPEVAQRASDAEQKAADRYAEIRLHAITDAHQRELAQINQRYDVEQRTLREKGATLREIGLSEAARVEELNQADRQYSRQQAEQRLSLEYDLRTAKIETIQDEHQRALALIDARADREIDAAKRAGESWKVGYIEQMRAAQKAIDAAQRAARAKDADKQRDQTNEEAELRLRYKGVELEKKLADLHLKRKLNNALNTGENAGLIQHEYALELAQIYRETQDALRKRTEYTAQGTFSGAAAGLLGGGGKLEDIAGESLKNLQSIRTDIAKMLKQMGEGGLLG